MIQVDRFSNRPLFFIGVDILTESELEKVRELLEPVTRSEEVELVDVELAGGGGKKVLRVTIDREGGVDVEKCADVSRHAELVLEAEDVIEGSYTLEVSSPGLTRPLKKPADYKRALGKLAALSLRKPLGRKRKALVIIEDADESGVTVTLKDTGERAVIEYGDIAKANLEIEF